MTKLRVVVVAVLAGFALAAALSPLEGDRVLASGDIALTAGRCVVPFTVEGKRPVGLYLNLEGAEAFSVLLNGEVVTTVAAGKTKRTRIRTVDLHRVADRLRAGANELEIVTSEPAPGVWLRFWGSDAAWYDVGLHAHSTYSDGDNSVHDLLQLALGEGAEAFSITDHNEVAQCYDTAFHAVGGLSPIRGSEWTSDLGHANALGFEGAGVFSVGTVRQLIDDASYRGAVVQVNHPCDDELGFGWDRVPLLDSGLDCIEVFNGPTWFPGMKGGRDSDGEAIDWWHSLLASGRTIAATGNSDYHGTMPGEGGPMSGENRVYAPSNHPDSILRYVKFGQSMVMDEPEDGRLYLYADTNNNGTWDLIMGQHARVTATRTIRFRVEVEDADMLDDLWIYKSSGSFYNHWFWSGGGDFSYEWTTNYGAGSQDFVRVLLEDGVNDPELLTNPIYINYPDYELGPTNLASAVVAPDSTTLPQPETLRFRLDNTAGYSPYRFGMTVACDTADYDIVGWQTGGTGIGQVENRAAGTYEVLEWRGGYQWSNRLPVGASFDYWLVVQPRAGGHQPFLFRSWANDRIQDIEYEPAAGLFGPENRYWHSDSIFVRHFDVQPLSIDVPAATIDSSGPLVPRVTVRNNGSVAATFDFDLSIGSWSGTATATGLAAGASVAVNFGTPWQPARGSHAMTAVTRYAPDQDRNNDTLAGTTLVRVTDIGVSAIIAPAGNVSEGAAILPRADIANWGTEAVACDLRMVVASGGTPVYDTTETGISVPVGGISGYTFTRPWTASPTGDYTTECYTLAAGDLNHGNDTARGTATVVPAGALDAAVRAILFPVGNVDTGTIVLPRATVANEGSVSATFDVAFYVTRDGVPVFGDTAFVTSLAPGSTTTASFAEWPKPHATGDYATRCTTLLVGDAVPANDLATGSFTVTARLPWLPGWREMPHVPEGTPAKPVKDGGWLAYHAGDGLIYAAKGNKQLSFYAYDPLADTWTGKAGQIVGQSGRLPYKGAHGCSDGADYLYATRGNNTYEFYRFDAAGNAWTALEDIPLGGNKVKGGTDMAYVEQNDSGFVYLLKGYRNEFYRYNVGSRHWETLTPAPAGASQKYDKGSFLAYDGAGKLYVHQAKYHKLYSYDVAAAAWTTDQLEGMPGHSDITGRNKKSKDGGCGAWSNGGIYALKGGNTQEYWRYFALGNTWAEYDTMPQYTGYTGRKKKVKAGADITSFADGMLFALKGNKTFEFWRWVDPTVVLGARPARDGVTAGRLAIDDCRLSIAPNPLVGGFANLTCNLPAGAEANVSVHDALGRSVFSSSLVIIHSSLPVDLRNLPAGVYLVTLTTTDGHRAAQKLVIER